MRAGGFTLIELLIVMAMTALLVAAAAPSFMPTVRTNRLDSAGGDLRSAIQLARSEAIKRSGVAVVEPLVTGNWASGFRVYVEPSLDPTSGYNAATDILIRQWSPLRNVTTVTGAPTRLAFDYRGMNVALSATATGRTPQTSTVGFCISPSKRTLTINPGGFVQYADASC
jgi:type IV fimbrial biogenesis protein FimT